MHSSILEHGIQLGKATVHWGRRPYQLPHGLDYIRLSSRGRGFPACCSVVPATVVSVAQPVERWIVAPVVVGSIPITHPIFHNLSTIIQPLKRSS